MSIAAYDMIDRYLRNNLDDDDYTTYSQALDELSFGGQSSPEEGFLGCPVAYQYNYPDGYWRCNHGEEMNGMRPTASRALYARKDGK